MVDASVRYFSMFSGIGGFELGIECATGAAGNCVGYSEIDRHAIKTYESHFGHTNYGDCTTIEPAGLPDFGLLVGGFPCQAFSVAGKRRGFEEARGTLFFDIARVLKDKRPGHFILENVKGLLSHDAGKTFGTILGVLSDLGYSVEWCVLNSKDFGVPQNRERVYIVGHFGGRCGR
jgi:DNA (cytosine-5)-methyltransferase 1